MTRKKYSSHKDKLFAHDIGKQFEFDKNVASVFDDMLERSIPYYKETLELIVDFIKTHLQSSCNLEDGHTFSSHHIHNHKLVYDLGSSTGTALLALDRTLRQESQSTCNIELIGIDNSFPMVEKARLKAETYGANIHFLCEDILTYELNRAEVIIASYILQFIRPIQRPALLSKLYECLSCGGILIVSEKMNSTDRNFDRYMIERYLRYKREKGYTQGEIIKKREALENVLIPFSLEENITLLRNAGFESIEVLFKWVNFSTLIAKKPKK